MADFVEIPRPKITGDTPEKQIKEINSYLIQLSERLNYALNMRNTTEGDHKNGK